MPQARRSTVGQVALVFGGGDGLGRDIALQLAAQEMRVVVAGPDERAVGRVVGEITCGGAAARHVVADAAVPEQLERAVRKAMDAFGGLTHVVLRHPSGIRAVADQLAPRLAAGGRLLLVVDADENDDLRASVSPLVRAISPELEARGATINALLWTDRGRGDTHALLEIVDMLLGQVGDRVSGQTLEVRGQAL